MKPEDCIFYILVKASQAGNKVWKEALTGFGITAVQGMVLNFLHAEDHITSKELGRKTMLDSATLTGILDRLEAVDLIRRTPHPEDRRAVIIDLTDSGQMLVKEIYQKVEAVNEIFLKSLDSEEEQTLRKLLTKVRSYSDKALAEVKALTGN